MREIERSNREGLEWNRRRFVSGLGALGLGGTLLPGALLAIAQDAKTVTADMVASAAGIAGLDFSEAESATIAERLNGRRGFLKSYQVIRDQNLTNGDSPALVFNPVPMGMRLPTEKHEMRLSPDSRPQPKTDDDLAFASVRELSALIRSRTVTSVQLTRLYLERLKKYDPMLHCVVNLTESLALDQARQADGEVAAGRLRGPLHGIPWGAKDLLSVPGYPTTWGASPYKDQVLDETAAVFSRLTEAGAVLVAKLSMGALAQGDRWFGGRTRNPWNTEQGSSGSSAGPGSATAAGLVGFGIGTETRGSIISPSSRCGITGLRPTFGMVSRHGAMALSWSMDKIGPMCRSAEDCALVLDAIAGVDPRDEATLDVPFNWDAQADVRKLRVGYLKSQFERETPPFGNNNPERAAQFKESQANLHRSLDEIRSLGVNPRPVEFPEMPSQALGFILTAEAAAAFDELTRSKKDEMMLAEPESSRWPDAFRLHRMVPAVEYLQANRVRRRLIQQMAEFFEDFDVIIGSDLGLTNLTGHPEICLPNGFYSNGSATNIRFTGRLFGDADIALLAHAFQSNTNYHRQRPPLEP